MSSDGSPRARRAGLGPWLPWLALALVVAVALAVGTIGQAEPSDAVRARNLADTIKCPQCQGETAALSDTPSSQAIRALIAERIDAGDSDEEIRDFVATRYPGSSLDPSGSGFTGLVWALPVVVVVAAVAGLVYRFRDWRPGAVAVTQADRDLVARALDTEAAPQPQEERAP